MFGRAAVVVFSGCALFSLLWAGETRAPAGSRRAARRYAVPGRQASWRTGARQLPAWLPQRMMRQRPASRRQSPTAAGSLGDAFMVDTGVAPVPASGWQYPHGVASNGDGWRVMWADDWDYSVRTSGIGSDGSLLDPGGTLVGHEQYYTEGLTRSIAGTGSGFIAVWSADDYGMWGARLDSAGALIDTFLVSQSDSGLAQPAVAFDGDSTCLVAWTENAYGNADIYAARVTTGGRVLDPVPIRVAQESWQLELWPTVAFGQGVYLVAWTSVDTSFTQITAMAVRVSPDGVVQGPAVFLRTDPGMMQLLPAVAFGDTCFLASWTEGLQQLDVYAARVSVSGNLIDSAGIQLSSGPTMDWYVSAGFDGANYLVMWCESDSMGSNYALRGRRITVDGVPLDSGLIRPEIPGYSCEYPSVAADQANFLVAFSAYDTLTYDYNACCTRISPAGAVLDSGIFLPVGADAQYGPSGASDGADFLSVWLEARASGSAVSAARISADGVLLDSVGFLVSDAPRHKYSLSTMFGDSLYLVAWADYRGPDGPDIYCARVSRDGQVLDTNGIVVCDEAMYQDLPDISFDGNNFLVVWQDRRSGMYGNIYAARVSRAGVVLDPNGFVVAAADTFDDAMPAVCYTGTDHLVVWQGMDLSSWESGIYGALVSPAGTITRPRFEVSCAAGDQRSPAVVRGPTNSLVAWDDNRDISAARVGADGAVLDLLLVAGTDFDEQMPRVISDEAGFRVLWRRWEYSDSTFFAAARVDTSGNVMHVGDWFGLPGYDNGFDAAYGSGSELLLIFSCWTDSAQGRYYGNDRLWGRLGEVPGIEQADTRQLGSANRGASIVRGVLLLPRFLDPSIPRSLLDISGRNVLDLRPGANDVRALAPGVYFVRETRAQAQAVRKVVIAK